MNKLDLEETTRRFHNVYEQVAKEYGYKTREDTKELDFNSPNGMTMLKTVETITTPYLEEIERLNNIIKEKNKDFELLRKAQLKKCQEYEDLEKLNNANYQSFIEVNNIINNAIEFLKENACIDEDVEYFCDDLRYDDCKKLLNILKGSDK